MRINILLLLLFFMFHIACSNHTHKTLKRPKSLSFIKYRNAWFPHEEYWKQDSMGINGSRQLTYHIMLYSYKFNGGMRLFEIRNEFGREDYMETLNGKSYLYYVIGNSKNPLNSVELKKNEYQCFCFEFKKGKVRDTYLINKIFE